MSFLLSLAKHIVLRALSPVDAQSIPIRWSSLTFVFSMLFAMATCEDELELEAVPWWEC